MSLSTITVSEFIGTAKQKAASVAKNAITLSLVALVAYLGYAQYEAKQSIVDLTAKQEAYEKTPYGRLGKVDAEITRISNELSTLKIKKEQAKTAFDAVSESVKSRETEMTSYKTEKINLLNASVLLGTKGQTAYETNSAQK